MILTVLFQNISFGQSQLHGKVFRAGGEDSIIAGANITNLTKNITATSAKDGTYRILADSRDQVSFSFIGLVSDTVIVEHQLLISGYDAVLGTRATTLERVVVSGNYQQDSANRREAYRDIYDSRTGITGGNTPTGFGLVLSPSRIFSKDSRQKRTLKKRLKVQEEEAYIDYMFPAFWVSSVTGLKGDSLRLFMFKYRPTYQFCRQNDRTGLTLYVNEKYKEFRNPKK